jgi:hypothetical protein
MNIITKWLHRNCTAHIKQLHTENTNYVGQIQEWKGVFEYTVSDLERQIKDLKAQLAKKGSQRSQEEKVKKIAESVSVPLSIGTKDYPAKSKYSAKKTARNNYFKHE